MSGRRAHSVGLAVLGLVLLGSPSAHARLSPENGYGLTTLHTADAGPAGDVVDLFNGSVWISEIDVFLPGPRGLDLELVRSYSSQRARADEWHELSPGVPTDTTWLGRGWELTVGYAFIRPYYDSNFDQWFDGSVTFDGVHGEEIRGEPTVPQPPALPYRSQSDLRIGITDAGTWVYVTDDGMAALRRDGRLYLLEHGLSGNAYPNGSEQTWSWYVTRIENRFGDWIDVEYAYEADDTQPADAIAWITDSIGRSVTFDTSGGALQSVTYPGPAGSLTRTYQVGSTVVPGVMYQRLNMNGEPYCTPGLPTGLPTSVSLTVPVLESTSDQDGQTHQFTYAVEEVYGHDSFPRARAPSPNATNDGTAVPEATIPMQFVALETVVEPTGLTTTFTYEPEAYFAGVQQPLLACSSGCVVINCGDPDLFWWESRLVAATRTVTGPGLSPLAWTYVRPQLSSLTDVDVPSSCGSQDTPQTEPAIDLERTVVVSDPLGIDTTYTFEQWDADYALGSPGANQAYCTANPADLAFYPADGDLSPARGVVLAISSAEGSSSAFEEHVYDYQLWQHSLQPYATSNQASWVPVLQSRSTFVDGLPYASSVATAPPDLWGRQGGWAHTSQADASGTAFEVTTEDTAYFASPSPAHANWNLVELPFTSTSTFAGVTTADETYTWGLSGDALGRLAVLEEDRVPSVTGPPQITSFSYANAPTTTTVTVTPATGVPTDLVLGPGGVESVAVGGDIVETATFSPSGHPLTSVDERGLVSEWSWDSSGRLEERSLTGPGVALTSAFDWSGWPQSLGMTDAEGSTSTVTADVFGRITQADVPLDDSGSSTSAQLSWSYMEGLSGSEWTASLPGAGAQATITGQEDARSRPTSVTTAPPAGERNLTWTNAFEVQIDDGQGGRTWDVSRAADGTTRGVSGTGGDCVQRGPAFIASGGAPGLSGVQVGAFTAEGACSPGAPASRMTEVVVDSTGALAGEADTGHGGSTVARDTAGRIEDIDFADGSVVSVAYEAGGRGRPESITWSGADGGSDVVTLGWGTAGDAAGRLESISGGVGSATFDYSPLGPQTLVTDEEDYTASGIALPPSVLQATSTREFELDDQGRLESVIYSDGSEVVYTWHSSDNLDTVTFVDAAGTAHPVVLGTEWSAFGMESRSFANGMGLSINRDGHGLVSGGQVTGIQVGQPDDYWENTPIAFGEPMEVCTDGADNDGNGDADCADLGCFDHVACQFVMELCGDGIDNDLDGATDCDDVACVDTAGCAGGPSRSAANGSRASGETWDVLVGRNAEAEINEIVTTFASEQVIQQLGRDSRNRVTSQTNVAGGATWTLGWDADNNLTDLDSGGQRPDLDYAAQQWFSNQPSGGGWVTDPGTGNVLEAPGLSNQFGNWQELTNTTVIDSAGVVEKSYTRTHNSRGLVAIEFDDFEGLGRWYRYGPGSAQLLEELTWDPTRGEWVPFRNYIWDPQSGELVGYYENPLVFREAPPCPAGLEVVGLPDRNELSWLPAPLAHHYIVYRNGVPMRFVEAAEPWFRDFNIVEGQLAVYEVRSVSALGIQSGSCATDSVVSAANPAFAVQWDPPTPPVNDLAGYLVTACPAELWDPDSQVMCPNLTPVSGAVPIPPSQTSFTWDVANGYVPTQDWVMLISSVDTAGNDSLFSTVSTQSASNGVAFQQQLATHPESAGLQVVITSAEGLRNIFAQAVGGDLQGFFGVEERSVLGTLATPLAMHLTGIDPRTGERASIQPGVLISQLGVRYEGTDVFAEHVTGGGPATFWQRLSTGYQGLIRPGLDELLEELHSSPGAGGNAAMRGLTSTTSFVVEMIAMLPVGILELGNHAGFAVGVGSQDAYELSGWEKVTVGIGAVGDVAALAGPIAKLGTGVAGAARASRAGSGARVAKTRRDLGCPCCFPAGTLVSTPDGFMPIEELVPGDLVLSRAEGGGELVYSPVTEVFETEDRPLIELVLEGEDGQLEAVRTTPEHPFAVTEAGPFVEAWELEPGDIVSSAAGWLRLASGTWLQERATGYNLTVEGEHTYFVGEAQAWVHNTSVGGCPCGGEVLFRGTTEGYAGSRGLQRIGVTPTSSDPVVATLFGIESSNHGRGVLLMARRADVPTIQGNVLASLEAEVGVNLAPAAFAQHAKSVTVDQARTALSKLGVQLPARIADKASLDRALRDTARLTPDQIDQFLRLVGK